MKTQNLNRDRLTSSELLDFSILFTQLSQFHGQVDDMSDITFSRLVDRIFSPYFFILFCHRIDEIQEHILTENTIV